MASLEDLLKNRNISTDLLTSVLNLVSDSVYIIDRDFSLYYANDSFKRLAKGWNIEDDLVNKSIPEAFKPIFPDMKDQYDLIINKGSAITTQEEFEFDARRIYTETIKTPVFDDSGNIDKIITIVKDVTEIREKELELRILKEYQNIVENSNSIILTMDEHGNVFSFNRFAEDFFGYHRDEIVGRNVKGTIVPRNGLHGDIKADLSEMIKDIVIRPEHYVVNENENRTKDGRQVYVQWSNSVIQGDDGKIKVLCVGQDITEKKVIQENLIQIRNLYRTFIDANSDMIFLKDEYFDHLIVNKAMANFFNLPENKIIGRNDFELMPKEFADRCRESDLEALLKGIIVLSEEKIGDRYYDTNKFPVDLGDGKVGIGGIIRDITERKNAEDHLKKMMELEQVVFDHNPIETIVVNRKREITRLNIAKKNGKGRIPNIGDIMYGNYAGNHTINMSYELDDAINTGKNKTFDELPYGDRWLSINIAPFDGGAVITSQDITRRKNAEKALLESEQLYRALFEKSPIGIAEHRMVYDESGNPIDYYFLNANVSYKKFTGVDPVGKLVTEAFPGIEKDKFDWIGKFAKVAKTGEELRVQRSLELNNRWYDLLAYQNKPDHFVVTFIEITEQKKAEKALAELQGIEVSKEVINRFSHTLNNKLQVISGYVKMALHNEELDPLIRSDLEIVNRASGEANEYMAKLKKYAEEEKSPSIYQEYDLSKLLDEAIKYTRNNYINQEQMRSIIINTDYIPDLKASVNYTNLRDTLSEIMKNSVEVMPDGGTIDIALRKDEEYAYINIKDTGKGMDKNAQEELFKPFIATKGNNGYRGINMCIAYSSILKHNGMIRVVSSDIRKGTEIEIKIPYLKE